MNSNHSECKKNKFLFFLDHNMNKVLSYAGIIVCLTFVLFFPQPDMLQSLTHIKPTVNDEDLKRLIKFTEDFGQEG